MLQPALDDTEGKGSLHLHYRAVRIRSVDLAVSSPKTRPHAKASDTRVDPPVMKENKAEFHTQANLYVLHFYGTWGEQVVTVETNSHNEKWEEIDQTNHQWHRFY